MPTRLIGTAVRIVVDHGALLVVEPATGEIVAEHELAAPGTASILDAHYDRPRLAPHRGRRPKTRTEHQFCALGQDAEAFLVGAAAIGNTRLGAELEILLGLAAAHGDDVLVAWPFEQWGRFLPEHTTAASILDRLLHHAMILVTSGESFRMRESQLKRGDRP